MTERRRFVESGKEEMVLKTRMDKETVGVEDGSKTVLSVAGPTLTLPQYFIIYCLFSHGHRLVVECESGQPPSP